MYDLSTLGRSSPEALAPFFHEIQGMGSDYFQEYKPNETEMRYQMMMHKNMEEALEYRRQFEPQWEFGIRRMNLLTEPLDDDRLSNVLIPIVKIVIMARLAAMIKGQMDVTYVPGFDDDDKIDLWKDARRYVNTKCNYDYEMQRAYLLMSLFGSAPLMDGYRSQYQTLRVPSNGQFKEIVAPDPRHSMVFTESIMPWNYLVSGGGRDHHDAPHYTLTKYMDFDPWTAEFARVPKSTGKPMYMHTRSVKPGEANVPYKDPKTGKIGVRTQKLNHRKVCVNYHFIPVMDLMMIESNGVLNWIGPNPYKHKRSPFSMLRLHPQMDANGGNLSVYGQGDAWLLSGLDTLYQNTSNMFVDSFYLSNSSVIGVPHGLNLDVEDEVFYGGTVLKGAENMIVSQLGRVDGQSFNFMWKMLNDLIVWATGVPFNQLVPEGQITAYELSKRVEKASERQQAIMKMNECYGLKESEEKKISNIFQFLPQEEFYGITDPDQVDALIKQEKIAKSDVVWEDGIPVMVRTFPMLETKGRVIQEKFVNGLPVADGAKIIEKGVSGRLAARPEYIHPTEWLRNNGIPDVYVNSASMFGIEDQQEKENVMNAANFALSQNERAHKMKKPLPFDEEEIHEDAIKTLGRNTRKWLSKNTQAGTRLGRDIDTKELQQQAKAMINERDMVPELMEEEVPPASQFQVPGAPSPQTQLPAAAQAPTPA